MSSTGRFKLLSLFLVLVLVAVGSVPIVERLTQGQQGDKLLVTIGSVADASGTADFVCDGVNDNVQFQLALNNLDATGGKILVVSSGTFNFGAGVTRAIPNVTIEGTGYGTYITGVASITAGGNSWKIVNMRFDAGGMAMGATTNWIWENVDDGGTRYTLRNPSYSLIGGAEVVGTSITDSGLTAGRVVYAGAAGLLSTDAGLTFDAATNALTAGTITDSALTAGRVTFAGAAGLLSDDADLTFSGSTTTATNLDVATTLGVGDLNLTDSGADNRLLVDTYALPRTSTFTVAANNASAAWKAQADYICDGVADEVQINAAIAALPTTGGTVVLSDGTFNIAASITTTKDHVRLVGQGSSEYGFYVARGYGITTLLATADINVINFTGTAFATMMIGSGIENLTVRGFSKAGGKAGVRVEFVDVFNINDVHSENNGYGYSITDSWAVQIKEPEAILNNIGLWIASSGAGSSGNHDIVGGFFAHNDTQGVYINGNNQVVRNRFTGVHFHNNGQGLADGRGIYIKQSHSNTITGGQATDDLSSDGIALDRAHNNTITGVVVNGNLHEGIVLFGSYQNTVVGNIVWSNGTGLTNAYDGIHVVNGGGTNADYNIISNNQVHDNDRNQVNIESGTGNSVTGNQIDLTVHGTGRISNGATNTYIRDNIGYIAPGEHRTYTGSLASGNANAFTFAFQNPEGQAVIVTELMVDVTTPGGTALSVLDAGTAADGTTHSSDLIVGADLNTTATYVSTARPKLAANGGATDWITGQILTANAAALAGKYYVEVVGQ